MCLSAGQRLDRAVGSSCNNEMQPPKLGVRRASPAAPRGAHPASVALGDDALRLGIEELYSQLAT